MAGDHITLVKNDTYYRASEGLPHLDTLIFRIVSDTNQLIAQLASGECDMGTQDAAFEGSLPLIRQFEAQGLMAPQVVAGTVFEHLDFNTLALSKNNLCILSLRLIATLDTSSNGGFQIGKKAAKTRQIITLLNRELI